MDLIATWIHQTIERKKKIYIYITKNEECPESVTSVNKIQHWYFHKENIAVKITKKLYNTLVYTGIIILYFYL